jgi:hypothetical protein
MKALRFLDAVQTPLVVSLLLLIATFLSHNETTGKAFIWRLTFAICPGFLRN